MALTTTTTLADFIHTEVIDELLISIAYQESVVAPFFRFKNLAGQRTDTATFSRLEKKSPTNPITNESTALVPVAATSDSEDVQVAEVGIAFEVTKNTEEDNILGDVGLMNELVEKAARLLDEAMDEDAGDEFGNAAHSVDSEDPITFADLIAAIGKARTAHMKGSLVFNLHSGQLAHLQTSQAGAEGTIVGDFMQVNFDNTMYGGRVAGADIWASSLNPTADGGDTLVGCLYSKGPSSPEHCAFALAVKRNAETEFDKDVLGRTKTVVVTSRYGVGTIADDYAVALLTSADAAGES